MSDESKHGSKYEEDTDLFTDFEVRLPDEYSKEEKQLQRDFGILKQLKKALSDLKSKLHKDKLKEDDKSKVVKPSPQAKEQAKKLLKSGAIKLSGGKDKHTFKRKNKESDGLHLSDDEEAVSNSPAPTKKMKPLYDSFISSNTNNPKPHSDNTSAVHSRKPPPEPLSLETKDPPERKRKQQIVSMDEGRPNWSPPRHREPSYDSDEAARQTHGRSIWSRPGDGEFTGGGGGGNMSYDPRNKGEPRKGNTVFVKCHDLTRELIQTTFSRFGRIAHVNIDHKRDRAIGFVTFENLESAEESIDKLNDQYEHGRVWMVTYARKQHPLQGNKDISTEVWGQIAKNRSVWRAPRGGEERRSDSFSEDQDQGFDRDHEDEEKSESNPARGLVSYTEFE